MNRDSSIAILHDQFPTMGGAERVAIKSAQLLNAPIYTARVAPNINIPSDVRVYETHPKKYNNGVFNHIIDSPGAFADQVASWSLKLDLSDIPALSQYDLILESNHTTKHYTPDDDQTILHYVHTLPQYYYNLYHYALTRFDYPVISTLTKLYIKTCRLYDKEANDYVDQFIANSQTTQDRIDKYYNKPSEVVYPPVEGEWRHESVGDYFVTWSRLAPRKRTMMIAEAFSKLDERLIIAGEGPEREQIAQLADENTNIEFRGYVENIEALVANAKAVVYAPIQEPFGMVGAESLSAGKPILGVDEGFLNYMITSETGYTFHPNIKSLIDTVEKFDPDQFDYTSIEEYGKQFNHKNFESSLQSIIDQYI